MYTAKTKKSKTKRFLTEFEAMFFSESAFVITTPYMTYLSLTVSPLTKEGSNIYFVFLFRFPLRL